MRLRRWFLLAVGNRRFGALPPPPDVERGSRYLHNLILSKKVLVHYLDQLMWRVGHDIDAISEV